MGPSEPVILDTIDAVTAAIAFTIDPARRRRGLATAAIRALVGDPARAAEGTLYYDAPGASGGPSPDAVSSRS
jgi:hypothetical protein